MRRSEFPCCVSNSSKRISIALCFGVVVVQVAVVVDVGSVVFLAFVVRWAIVVVLMEVEVFLIYTPAVVEVEVEVLSFLKN